MVKRMRKIPAILLTGMIAVTFAFAMGAVSAQEVCADEHSHDGWTKWTSNSSLPESEGKYYLTDNVKLSDTWYVRQGTVSLCLNGHSITMASGDNAIIINRGRTLNLYDCGTDGTITHASDVTGSGFFIDSGTFNMYGGTIRDNEAMKGGGVYVINGTFNMHGGTIRDNEATEGGGVYMEDGTFNISGGTITGNTASRSGGGILVVFKKIIQLSGSPQITGNTANGKADNMFFGGDAKAEITGELNTPEDTSGPQIGVSMGRPGVFTSGLKNNLPSGKTASDLFFSDDGNYALKKTTDGEAQLVGVAEMNGDGTADAPYEITSYKDLNEFASIVNGTHPRVSQNTAACGKLMNDIQCTDKEWVPIGTEDHPYIGHFDGNNKVIKGLSNEERPDVNSADHQGLFGYIGSGGSVVDAGLEGGKIRGSYSGGVAGQNAGAITNCYNTGAVSGDHVGGVAAHNAGTITDCHNTGEITGGAYEGGVVALNEGTITNCYNTASFGSGQVCCGGIAAQNEGTGTITNCYNTGAIGPGSDDGGVAGQNAGTIKSCYNIGEVSAGANQAGGMAGLNEGTITNCYNSGDVSAGGNHAGGIAGLQNKGKITSCYNTGAVGPVGGDHVGGVAGRLEGGEITNCYNTGAVGPAGGTGVGGVAGSNKGTITNCYNIGAVRGYVPGGVAERNSGTITNCYYDMVFCTAEWAVLGKDTDTVKGLSTSEMTGDSAIGENHMVFSFSNGEESPWLVRANEVDEANGEYCEYYPHLKGFNLDSEGKPLEAEDIALADWPAKHIIKQAQPEIITPPTAPAIAYGQSLADSRFSGGLAKAGDTEVPGTFTWTDSAIKPTVSDSGKTEYEVTFTPNDTRNYKTATTKITLTVNKADITPTVSIQGWSYGSEANRPVVDGNTGGSAETFWYKEKDALDSAYTQTVPADAGQYTIRADIAETENYSAGSATFDFSITQAQPAIETVPTASAITEGQTLADSILSDGIAKAGDTVVPGTFSWTDATIKPTVSDSGNTEYEVTFTPADAKNYSTVTFGVTLTINKKEEPVIPPDDVPVDPDIPVVDTVELKTVGNFARKEMKIFFHTDTAVTKYQIQYRMAGETDWQIGWSEGTDSYTFRGLDKSSLCEFRIAGFVELADSSWVRGEWSDISYRYMKSVKLKSVKAGKKRIKLTWAKDKKGNGYQIKYYTDKNIHMADADTVTIKGKKKTKCTIRHLKKGQTYYVRIRPIKIKGGIEYIGILKNTKKVRIK